ncbi:MAG: FGGY-family carbohydrate kinase [Cetobacterium sp.]
MKNKYIVGIDGGSQSTKVTIFDLKGNVVCEGKQNLNPYHLPSPGVAEHPGDDLWDSTIIATKKALANFKGDKKDIIGVGVCSIRCCKVYLKEDGTLAQPVMSWMDKRAYAPYEDENPDVKYVVTTSGYMNHRFTGQKVDTSGNYVAGGWPFNFDKWNWSENEEDFKNLNLKKEMLFELKNPGTIVGYTTKEIESLMGLPAGLPVVQTSNDKAVEALGVGAIKDDTLLVSLGTYITSMIHAKQKSDGGNYHWTNAGNMPSSYLYESSGIRRGMWTVSWLRNLLGKEVVESAKNLNISPEEYMNKEAEKVPAGSDGLMTILDWLAPNDALYKRGMMIGFDGHMGSAHMYRSILEAIAFTMKNNADAMTNELQINVKNLVISGGGSNSDLFMQIFADVFGKPTVRNVVNGAAAMGTAISTAVALGIYKTYEEAVTNMVKVKDTFEPNLKNTELYDELNEKVYKQVTNHTDNVLKKSFEILYK